MSDNPYIWKPNPHNLDFDGRYESDDILENEEGNCIARVEDFGYSCYPMAINAKTGNLERGGAFSDRVAAKLWCERVAGLHPSKSGDERPAFYYDLGTVSKET